MDKLPEKIEPGGAIEEKVTSSLINRMLAAIRACTPPDQVKGGRIAKTAAGWLLAIDPGRNSSSADHPWKVRVENAEKREVTLTPSFLNNSIPLIGSDRMIVSPRPVLTLPNVSTVGIYLKVTVDGSMESTAVEVVAAEIDTVSNSLDLQTGGIGYELLASAVIEDGAIVAIHQGTKTKLYHRAYLKHIFWT